MITLFRFPKPMLLLQITKPLSLYQDSRQIISEFPDDIKH